MKWLLESNRLEHLAYAIPIAAVFTILCVLGLASGMEFKDSKRKGGKWDWLDWTSTMIGGVIGQAIQLSLIILLS